MQKEVKIAYMMMTKDWNAFLKVYSRWDTSDVSGVNKYLSKYSLGKAWYIGIIDGIVEKAKRDDQAYNNRAIY